MESFWNKPGYLVLGLGLGALSGFLSTYDLNRYEALWRPSVLFFAFSMIPVYFLMKPKVKELIGLLFLYLISFLTAFLMGQIILGMMGIGSILVFSSLFWVLRMRSYRYFIVSTIIVSVIGLMIDLHLIEYSTWLDGEAVRQFQPGERLSLIFCAIIIIWQTITMGAIVLQMYSEKCYLQSVEAQKDLDGDQVHRPDSPTASTQ